MNLRKYEVFQQHFALLFGRSSEPEKRRALEDFLTSLRRLFVQSVGCCDVPSTAAEVEEALSNRSGSKSLGLDGLPYELIIQYVILVWVHAV